MSKAFDEAVRQMDQNPPTVNWTGNSLATTGTVTFTMPNTSTHTYGMAFDYYSNTTNDPNHWTITNISIS